MIDPTGAQVLIRLEDSLTTAYAVCGCLAYGSIRDDLRCMKNSAILSYRILRHLQAFDALLSEMQAMQGAKGLPVIDQGGQ